MPTGTPATAQLPEHLQRILEARHHDPFEVLGRHVKDGVCTLRLFLPKAEQARVAGTQVDVPRCLLYTSPSPRDGLLSRMPSSA